MKTVTIITIILFLAAVGLFSFLAAKYIGGRLFSSEDPSQPDEVAIALEEEIEIPDPVEEDDVEEPPEEIKSLDIETIEIYLDGDRDNGIFLGEAIYGLTSKEAYLIYGDDFSESGYILAKNNQDYAFEPGSVHYLYIYTFIPEYGWNFTREKVLIPGESDYNENIKLYIDNPDHNAIIAGDTRSSVRVSGWSADFSSGDNPGINKIEIYLNGPRDFGKFLGEASYGAERQDVADTIGNANYINSGYKLTFDASGLEDGSGNTLYVYSYPASGGYFLATRDIFMEGDKKESNVLVSAEITLSDQSIEISGWALNKNMIIEGSPRDLELEYSIKKIIFTSIKNGNEDIFSMNLDGTGLTQLTDYSGRDWYPSVSPDGKKIAYTSEINGVWQIASMNWDGTGKTQLTTNTGRSGYPHWSFDGRFIYFEVYKDGDWEIYRMESDGSGVKRLTLNTSAYDWHPFAHPFQYKIIYESGATGNEDLYMMDHDGSNIEKVSDVNMRKRAPTISADGEIIAFMGYEGNSFFIYTMDINGENPKKLTSLVNSGHPNISPDNAYITFQAPVGGTDKPLNEVFIMKLDGSDPIQLTDFPGGDWDPEFMYQLP